MEGFCFPRICLPISVFYRVLIKYCLELDLELVCEAALLGFVSLSDSLAKVSRVIRRSWRAKTTVEICLGMDGGFRVSFF